MTEPRDDRFNLAVWAAVTFVSAGYYLGYVGVILDDAYVYFRVVERFVATGVPTFNDGDTRNITTSPLWLAVLSLARLVGGSESLVRLSELLSIAFLTGASWYLFLILRERLRAAAPFSAIGIFFAPNLETLAGHDTAIALFCALAAIHAFLTGSRWLPLWIALMYLARGEGAVFGAVLAILALLQRPLVESVRLYWAAALAGFALIALWHGFYFLSFGELLPSTLKAKQLQAEGGFTTFDDYLPNHLLRPPATVALDLSDSRLITNSVVLAGGIAVLLWRAPLLVAWPLVHFAVYAQVGVPSYHWYYYPIDFLRGLAPIIAVAAVAAGAVMIARTRLLRAEPTRALVLAPLGMTAAGAMLLQPVLAHSIWYT
jgi:hypothetical protein